MPNDSTAIDSTGNASDPMEVSATGTASLPTSDAAINLVPQPPRVATTAWRNPKIKRIVSFTGTVGWSFTIVALQLGQGILLARLLGPVGRGEYAAAILYTQFWLYIGLMGGLEAICRQAASFGQATPVINADQDSGGDLEQVPGFNRLLRLRRSAFRLSIVTGLITTAIVSLIAVVAMPTNKRDLIPLAIVLALSITGQHVMLICTGVDRGTERFAAYNFRRVVGAAAFPALIGLAAIFVPITVTLACWMFVAASLVNLAVCVIGVPNLVFGPHHPSVREMLRQSRPYGLSMLVSDIFERLDLLLVLWLAPLVEQGFYAAMIPAVYPLVVIPHTLGVYLFNAGADSRRRLTIHGAHRVLLLSFAIQTVTTVGFWLTIGFAVRLFYGEDFEPAIIYAMWLAPVSAVRGILQGIEGYLKGRGRPLAGLVGRVLAGAALLIATAVLWNAHGVLAIAMAALVGQVICLIWLVGVLYHDCRSAAPLRE